jgi:hypothetical protein
MRRRTLTLALATTVLLGVGLLPAHIAAQQHENIPANRFLGPRVEFDFSANAAPNANPFGARLQVPKRLLPLPETAHVATPPPIDCAMPVIKGDPRIDPDFVKPLPPDADTHTLIVIPVPRCPERTSDYSYLNATIGSTRDARRAGR